MNTKINNLKSKGFKIDVDDNFFKKEYRKIIEGKDFIINSVVNPAAVIGFQAYSINSFIDQYVSIGNRNYIYESSFGMGTYTSENCSIMNTEIGRFCSIARNVSIGQGIHPTSEFISTHPIFYSPIAKCALKFVDNFYFKDTKSTYIGNDVWIGTNVVIFDGIKIGDGAIIGANSLVNKDVEPYTIVVGNPAKVLKRRFDDETITSLLKFKWWNKDLDWLEKNKSLFRDVSEFIHSIS